MSHLTGHTHWCIFFIFPGESLYWAAEESCLGCISDHIGWGIGIEHHGATLI